MRTVKTLPPAFDRFRAIGGALIFAVYEDAKGDDAAALAGISTAMPNLDITKLKSLGYRSIDKRTFFGDWYDAESGALMRLGRLETRDGQELIDPKFNELVGVEIVAEGSVLPEAGAGGQFAYAFSWTPYGLRTHLAEVQQLFIEITNFILPPDVEHQILDWSNPRLPEVSKFFAAGMEWWGVFLFTVYLPQIKRMTVIAGSTTD
jgi:hypothetical protein